MQHLVYAKKFRLPSKAANVLQAMNMAVAFGRAGADLRCFPGCAAEAGDSGGGKARERVLENALQGMGVQEKPEGWSVLPGERKGLYGARFRLALLRSALERKDRVFYARDLPELAFLASMKRFLPRTLVYEAHEMLHLMHRDAGWGRWRATLRREKRAFRAIDGLVTLNPQVLEEAREYLGYTGPALLAPNGFNPDLFHALPLFSGQNPWPAAQDAVLLVYVGNFHPGKGVEELLGAMALLPPRFRLRVIGGSPGDVFEALAARAKAPDLAGRVEFTGALPPLDLRAACAGAHLFVIPQQSEMYLSPLKLHEAMALGLPVLTAPLAVFQGPIRDGLAFGAPGADPAGLARGIAELADNPALAQSLREKGLAEAEHHTWRRRAEKILDFIGGLNR